MQHKVIENGKVIDVLHTVKYLRYLKKSKTFANSDSSVANCVQASDGKTIYGLEGKFFSQDPNIKIVSIIPITVGDYTELKKLLFDGVAISGDSLELHKARESKIKQLSVDCNNCIIGGVSVLLPDGAYHQFDLTTEDQLNLFGIERELNAGCSSYLYHERGGLCREFSAKELRSIIKAARKHITLQTTYFNAMKNCINNMYDISEINNIKYGDEIPDVSLRKLLDKIK